MEHAVVGRLMGYGVVRHGAECFNYYFPQEIDDEFLVISDRLLYIRKGAVEIRK
jgi:hypothetical protein